jgi:hypothetical protein
VLCGNRGTAVGAFITVHQVAAQQTCIHNLSIYGTKAVYQDCICCSAACHVAPPTAGQPTSASLCFAALSAGGQPAMHLGVTQACRPLPGAPPSAGGPPTFKPTSTCGWAQRGRALGAAPGALAWLQGNLHTQQARCPLGAIPPHD